MRAPFLLAALVLSGCAAAPVPPPARLDAWPAWQVGDSWTWRVQSRGSDGQVTEAEVAGTVVAVEKETYVVRSRASDGVASNVSFWRSNLSMVGARGETLRLPLEPGADWTSGDLVYRVVGLERVRTPAGEFDAWHVNATEVGTRPSSWRDDWWAPAAKIWARSRQVHLAGDGHVGVERELQTYEPASVPEERSP